MSPPSNGSLSKKPMNGLEWARTRTHSGSINIAPQTAQQHGGFMATRHIVLLLCMLANAISYTMRTNLSITIVSMVSEANKTDLDTCLANEENTQRRRLTDDELTFNWTIPSNQSVISGLGNNDGKLFEWSESLQGHILGAFYYGYIFSMATGGQLADLIGTKRLIAFSMTVCSLGTLAIPISANCHPYLVIAVRVLTGIAQGVVTPALYTILPHWTPKNELGMAFGLIQASGNLGAVLTMPICGFLAEYGFAGGWPSVFYFFGLVGVLFLVPWLYFVYNSPDLHPRVSPSERLHIISNRSVTGGKRTAVVPWRCILTSPKIWAIAVTRFCNGWGNLFLISKLPTYLKTILHMPITYNGYVNSSIYIALGGSALIWGYVSDYVGRKHWFTATVSRKLFQSLALFGGAFFLGLIPAAGCSVTAIITLLNLSMLTIGLTAGGESLIVVDVAPDYAGSIYGFTNAIASLPGFLAPLFVGLMLDQPNANPIKQWNIFFGIGAAIYVFGGVVFIFGTNSNVEKWGRAPVIRKATTDNSSVVVEKSKVDYSRSSNTYQVAIDVNNNDHGKYSQRKSSEALF